MTGILRVGDLSEEHPCVDLLLLCVCHRSPLASGCSLPYKCRVVSVTLLRWPGSRVTSKRRMLFWEVVDSGGLESEDFCCFFIPVSERRQVLLMTYWWRPVRFVGQSE